MLNAVADYRLIAGKRIAVLMGGPGSERPVSLASGAGVAAALRSLGAEVFEVDVHGPDFELPESTDLAFNVIHGTFGEDGQLQRILEARGVLYTGEGVAGSELAIDKIATKRRLLAHGVPTALFEVLRGEEPPTMPLPFVLKAPREGSSVGVYIVREPAEVEARLRDVRRFASEILVEEYVSGRELTVGILGETALPVVEICPKQGFYDFKNKYPFLNPQAAGADHWCPAPLEPRVAQQVQQMALAAHKALGLEVYSRVDFLLSEKMGPVVLEINTIPGMTQVSLLPEAAAAAGISYAQLCSEVINRSLQRFSAK
ncbi:MAG: D-alanine-D-alanine ligase [Verrucomicrobia bacterium]|nr:MAG: D-alanine-D-alanine ligase [Verrucomicrobiota bacterium]